MITAPDLRAVAMAGDCHGNLFWALSMIDRVHRAGVSVIIHLGDFGFWTPTPGTRLYLEGIEERLAEYEMVLLFVDGNHEDHPRLVAQPIDPATGLRPISAHVHHLPRGHRWTWVDEDELSWTWMALGRAVSVDRYLRTPGASWWSDEVVTESDIELAIGAGLVDVLVMHDVPARVAVPGLDRKSGWPADALRDADAHRHRLLRAAEAVKPRQLWHGHYHVRYDDRLYLGVIDDRPEWDGECHVHGLDCDGAPYRSNLVLARLDGALLPWPDEET